MPNLLPLSGNDETVSASKQNQDERCHAELVSASLLPGAASKSVVLYHAAYFSINSIRLL
ncbi:MAG: hypothetical protein Q8O92_01650 [Candidatus Latescibacter sp.]|nr:hypothetical protein [Candidatus Latescibacter sp.]